MFASTFPTLAWGIKETLGCANRDEQMSNGYPFSRLNDEQMSNKVRVEHQPEHA